jgi:ComF family protein
MWSMLAPLRCPLCGEHGGAPCARCVATLRRAPAWAAPVGLDECRSLLHYDRAAAGLLASLKYRDRRAIIPWLSEGMARLVQPAPDAVVTWASTSAARRNHRGFDQAELLARAVARRWHLSCRRLLERAPGPPQTGRDAHERRAPTPFRAVGPAPASVVLVDDIVTTGSSIAAAARALRAAGATHVIAVTGARTPLKVVVRSAEHSQ